MPELARATCDGGQHSKVLPDMNSYYMHHCLGLPTAPL